MKHAGRVAFVAGLLLAVALFVRADVGRVVALVRAAGLGLVAAAFFHLLPMLANARGWQALIVSSTRLPFRTAAIGTWIRESVNGLLPVARVGGEVAAYRWTVRHGVGRASVAASLLVDVVLSMVSQSGFALVGVAAMLDLGVGGRYTWPLAWGFAVLCAVGAALLVLQRSRVLGLIGELSRRARSGRFTDLLAGAAEFESALDAIHARPRRVASSVAWQTLGWLLGAGEVWLCLALLGRPASLETAVVIEAVVQTMASVAFLVPGAYGVQEGTYLVIGTALGIDGPTALALATARRVRDLVMFVPGLCVWSWEEVRHRSAAVPAVDA